MTDPISLLTLCKRHVGLPLTLLVFANLAFGQNRVDSLQKLLANTESPERRLEVLLELADEHDEADSARAWPYAVEAAQLALDLGNQEALITSVYHQGWALMASGHMVQARLYFDSTLRQSEAIEFHLGKARSLQSLAALAQQQAQYDDALELDSMALQLAQKLENIPMLANGHNNLGVTFESLGEYEKALAAYEEAESLFTQLNDIRALGRAQNNIGGIYANIGQLEKSLEYLLASLKIEEQFGNEIGVGQSYMNVALIYYFQQRYEIALDYLNRSLDIFKRNKSPFSLSYNYRGLGTIYQETGELEKALGYFLEAVALDQELGNLSELSRDYSNIGLLYASLGQPLNAGEYTRKSVAIAREIGNSEDIAIASLNAGKFFRGQGQKRQARKFLAEGLAIAKQIQFKTAIRDILHELAGLSSETGDFQAAYEYQVAFKAISDSLRNDERTEALAKLEAEYEFEKEKELLVAQGEKEQLIQGQALRNQRNLIFTVLGALVFSIIIVVILYNRNKERKQANSRLTTQKNQIVLQNQELEKLGKFKEALTGMIAHDLKTPLSVILSNSTEDNNEQSARNARKMLHLINNMLDVQKLEAAKMDLKVEPVNLRRLIEGLRSEVEPLMRPQNQRLSVLLPDVSVMADPALFERVMINLLTNAFKFSPPNSEVTVRGRDGDGKLTIEVMDKGKGIAAKDQSHIFESFGQLEAVASGGVGSTGLGLTFCKLALEAHGSSLALESEVGEGATFYFDIPLAGVKAENNIQLDVQNQFLAISSENRATIEKGILALRQYNLYQIGEIEKELASFKNTNAEIERWVEEVLNAAYEGNEARYQELTSL